MSKFAIIIIIVALSTQASASEMVASGFHIGINADAGVASRADKHRGSLMVSTGELEFGFQAENGFLVNGMFHTGYWGERHNNFEDEACTWATSGGGAQVGWKINRLRLLAGYQWAGVERERESGYGNIGDGYYYGPNAGISVILIDRAGINLDIGARSSALHWTGREDQEPGQNLIMTTAGLHLHLYPSQWENRGTNLHGRFWLHLPYEAGRFLMEVGPRLTLEILRAAVSVR